MSDGDYCGGVVISVSNMSSPFTKNCKKVKCRYMGISMFIPLSFRSLAMGS